MSPEPTDTLQAGREALERHDWAAAYEALAEADRDAALSGENLMLLAEAAWFAGQPDAVIDALERAHTVFREEGDMASAAMAAFRVAEQHAMRMAMPLAGGWMSKAEEMAAAHADWPVHGYLEWMRGVITWIQGDIQGAVEHYDAAIEAAARTDDRGLRGKSLHDKGHALCLAGRVREGFALMDQAMASAVAGEMEPVAAGYVYCGMISACSRLGDYGRAREWTEATTRWCERHSITGFPGVCRVHRAELLRVRGSWPQAEEEALLACEELPRFNLYFGLGPANYEVGEVRRRRGDLRGAEEAFARAHEFGFSSQPGLALLRLAQGKADAAMDAIRGALAEAAPGTVSRVHPLAAQAQIALAVGRLETAQAAADELEEIAEIHETTSVRATAAYVRGGVLLAEGRPEEALPQLRRAREGWQEVGAPYEVAEVRVLLGRAHGDLGETEAAELELKAARSAFMRLGAAAAAESAARLLAELSGARKTPVRVRRAFMFTDIVKSTDLVAAIGDDAWESLLSWHDQALRSLFASHGGEVAHHTGDGFFVAFESAAAALECAVAVQRALSAHRGEHGFAPQVRIGVHSAEATERGGDYGGAEVHKAARIAALAGGAEILASVETIEEAGRDLDVAERRKTPLKGFADPVEIASIAWS